MTEKDTDDRWYVQFDSAEVRLMTLDEIQEAFEAGLIHEKTYLIEVGKTDWQTLADVAGLSDEAEDASEAQATPLPVPVAPAPQTQPQPTYIQPQAASPAVHRAPAQAASGYPRTATPAADSAWPPVVAASRPGTFSSPPATRTGPLSTIPVVQDLGVDLDLDPTSFKSGKRSLFLFAAAAAAVIGGGGYAITRMDMPETPTAAAAPLAAPAMLSPTRPSTPASPSVSNPTTNTPAPSSPSTDPKSESAESTGKLSEDMKRALLAQDQDRTQKKKSRAAAPAGKRRGATGGGTVLKGGGGADDPLDPSL